MISLVDRLIGIEGREIANGLGNRGSIPGRVIPKTLKMVLDTSLLNIQHYKARIEGKVEQSRERSSYVVAIERGAFWSPSTTAANFTFFIISWEDISLFIPPPKKWMYLWKGNNLPIYLWRVYECEYYLSVS